jgi:hypothetical protein
MELPARPSRFPLSAHATHPGAAAGHTGPQRPPRRAQLRREFISEKELLSKLREHGVSELAEVRSAGIESDGNISVIRRQRKTAGGKGEHCGTRRPPR